MGGDARTGRQAFRQIIQKAINQGVDHPIALCKGSGILGENDL